MSQPKPLADPRAKGIDRVEKARHASVLGTLPHPVNRAGGCRSGTVRLHRGRARVKGSDHGCARRYAGLEAVRCNARGEFYAALETFLRWCDRNGRLMRTDGRCTIEPRSIKNVCFWTQSGGSLRRRNTSGVSEVDRTDHQSPRSDAPGTTQTMWRLATSAMRVHRKRYARSELDRFWTHLRHRPPILP